MIRARLTALVLSAGATLGCAAGVAHAAGPPPPHAPGGQKVKLVASGLQTPTSFAFGAGKMFEGDGGSESSTVPNGGVYLLSHGKGVKLAGSPGFASGLAWHKGSLYIAGGWFTSSGPVWQVRRWSKFNGKTFGKRSVVWTAPRKFAGTNGLAFAANGRLFLGVDAGLTDNNDHGPKTTSPYVYDILSMKANGKGLKVFATGIRQPWQMAFPKGSNSPFVSALGQDQPASLNPPDFILRVKQGDNYGFPKCNWKKGSPCKGYTKPYKLLAPHTDIMGMAIVGKRLYMTSFTGLTGKAGEVFSMPLKGGKLKPFVTGFVAPTVGLGGNGRSLLIGELTGQVFKVTP